MFTTLRNAKADIVLMKTLLPAAEQIARSEGVETPGAEHLLLASLDLDDAIAKDALLSFKVDQPALRAAINKQHQQALDSIGIVADEDAITSTLPLPGQPSGPYRSQGSLQGAFNLAVELAKSDKAAVNSGYLLLAIIEPSRGTVTRTLEQLSVDPSRLAEQTRRLLANNA